MCHLLRTSWTHDNDNKPENHSFRFNVPTKPPAIGTPLCGCMTPPHTTPLLHHTTPHHTTPHQTAIPRSLHATADMFASLKSNQDEPDVAAAQAVGLPLGG